MRLTKIKRFSDINPVETDPVHDKFVLPGGEIYFFSDHMCDNCWTAGTVLESDQEIHKYYCILCRNHLHPVTCKNDFLPPVGDDLTFFLPESWSKETQQQWYQEFKERRIAQEKVRERILQQGKE